MPSPTGPADAPARVHALELRIPPLLVVALAAAGMWFVARRVPQLALPLAASLALGIAVACVAAGAAVTIAGVAAFRRAHTTVDPRKPEAARAIVDGGIYRYTRNPMYLGFALALLGWGKWLANAGALLFVPAFMAYLGRFQIRPEERALQARFGAPYADYRRRVRRWL